MKSAALVARASNAGLAGVGVFWGALAAFMPDLKAGIGASDAAFGLALMMAAVGGIAAMAVAPRVMARLGRWGLPVAALGLATMFFVPTLPRTAAEFGIAMMGIGAAVSLLDIGSNMRLSDIEARQGRHLMNFSHAMFSFAFAGSALVSSFARKAGLGPVEILPLLAPVLVLIAVLTWEGAGWHAPEPAPEGADRRTPWRPILLAAVILLASFVSENATETWSALHIERTLGGAAGNGGFGPVALGLTMGVGRLMGQVAASRLGEAGLILWSALVAVVGAAVIALAPVPLVAVLGVGLLGLGVAVTVPSANSILGKAVRADQRGHAISRAWMIGFTGFFVGPSAMGAIAEGFGLRTAFLVVALVVATIVPSVRALGRLQR
ncbi:MAG: MFS transporter [Rhodobacteraceae bacterium]|nr:MFS transporter [Paracoccaceae bacterium]